MTLEICSDVGTRENIHEQVKALVWALEQKRQKVWILSPESPSLILMKHAAPPRPKENQERKCFKSRLPKSRTLAL